MKRRDLLKLTAGGLAAFAAGGGRAGSLHGSAPGLHSTRGVPDVVVVGAGVFGVWTAFHLRQRGARVVLLDAHGPGNSRSSSGGETRLMRVAYGDRTVYTRMGIESDAQWQALQDTTDVAIVLQSGRLVMSPEPAARDEDLRYRALMERFGTRDTEILDAAEIRHRWPQIRTDDIAVGVYNAGGAAAITLISRRSCRIVADRLRDLGGELRIAHASPEAAAGARLRGLRLEGGTRIEADRYVFAAGPWLGRLFPDLLASRLRVERRDVLFVGVPAGHDHFPTCRRGAPREPAGMASRI